MDVQVIGAAASDAGQDIIAPPPAPPPIAAFPNVSAAPPAPAPPVAAPAGHDDTLKHVVGQLVTGRSGTSVSVSYTVAHDPNEVVIQFKDAATGELLAQFPPELMVQLAEFFQKMTGALINQRS